MKKSQIIFTATIISLLAITNTYGQNGFQDVFGFENDNVNDTPEAPIHMLVYLGLVIGGYLGVKKLRSK